MLLDADRFIFLETVLGVGRPLAHVFGHLCGIAVD